MKQYLKVAAIALAAFAIANTFARRVPVVGPMVGRVLSGL